MKSIRKTIAVSSILALVLAFSTVVYSQDTTLDVSGYLKLGLEYSPSDAQDTSEFDINNARVKFAGTIDEKTSYSILVDGVNDDVLVDAFINYKAANNLSIKAGQFKTPYSTDNLTSATKTAFINRPYLRSDAAPSFRDRGVQVTYKYNMVTLDAAVLNGSGQNVGDTNNNKSMAYRAVVKVLPQLQLSGNFYTGKNDPLDDIREEFVNVGANGNSGNFEYSAEYATKTHDNLIGSALFAYVSYDINLDMECISILTPALRFETSDPNTDIDDNALSRIVLGLTAHTGVKHMNKLMVNYEARSAETGTSDDCILFEYQVVF